MNVQPPRGFSFAKDGNRPDENEDAARYSIPEPPDCSGRPVRLVIADGATESAFSKRWANILVNRFVDARPLDMANLSEETFSRWLEPCQREWDRHVGCRNIPWHGRTKIKAGAMATFVGVHVRPAGGNGELVWQATAVGDSCLFIIREGHLHTAFPVDDPGEFGNTPPLVCSNPSIGSGYEQFQQRGGCCRRGDLFILATDAVACWALTQHRQGADPWSAIAELLQDPLLYRERWIAERRADRTMRNDDATLLAVRIG